MNQQVLVNESVRMLSRLGSGGAVRPTSFVWRDKTRYVDVIGRQWEERIGGKSVRCYLIQSVDSNTFEVRHDPSTDEWTLHRAWLRDLQV
jgi:hypothetical protein